MFVMSIKILLSKEERLKKKELRKQKRLEKKEQRKNRIPTRKWVLPAIIISVVIYAGLDVILQIKTGSEISPTLTTCWFTFWAVELWNLASITKKKVDVDYEGGFVSNLQKQEEDKEINENITESEDELDG